MAITREQATQLLRPTVKHTMDLGNPTEAEITAKIAEVGAKSADEQARIMRKLQPVTVDDLQEQIDNLQSNRSGSQIIMMSLTSDLTIYTNATTNVGFASNNAINSIGLSYSNGVFTANRAVNLLVSYQLRWAVNANGYRQGSIAIGNDYFGRVQVPAQSAVATFTSGSSPIMLNRNDTFSIKAYQSSTDNIDLIATAGNVTGTKLMIVGL